MAIVSGDSYFSQVLTDKIDRILSSYGTDNQCYIIDEALRELNQQASEDFKHAYGGTAGTRKRNVEVTYSFPEEKEAWDAKYVVTKGQSTESQEGIGNDLATYEARMEPEIKEQSEVLYDEPMATVYVALKHPVGEYTGSRDTAGVVTNWEINNNQMVLAPSMRKHVGEMFDFVYRPLSPDDDGNGGEAKGFMADEQVQITAISNNINTVRCLNAILMYLLIILRESQRGLLDFQLQQTSSEPLQVMQANVDKPIYGITTTVSYRADYTVPYKLINNIKQFLFD